MFLKLTYSKTEQTTMLHQMAVGAKNRKIFKYNLLLNNLPNIKMFSQEWS